MEDKMKIDKAEAVDVLTDLRDKHEKDLKTDPESWPSFLSQDGNYKKQVNIYYNRQRKVILALNLAIQVLEDSKWVVKSPKSSF
jgi:hypothetical protein